MKLIYLGTTLNRLRQLADETLQSSFMDCYDRLRAFKEYCESTPAIMACLSVLPPVSFDVMSVEWMRTEQNRTWKAGDQGYAQRWSGLRQVVCDPTGVEKLLIGPAEHTAGPYVQFAPEIGRLFVVPLYNYLAHTLEATRTVVYLLLRYKRWVEWFEAERLRERYAKADRGGEAVLDKDLRRFLFESGIDYPFSQPDSPGGRADIVALLETNDPLVLEVKVWDSDKGYGENRVRDGLRQVMDYADRFGKDKGYVVVFNLDESPLELVSPVSSEEWPPRLEVGGKTYYFVDVNICEQTLPVSQRDRGKPVRTQRVALTELVSGG